MFADVRAKELELSDRPAINPSEESLNQSLQGASQLHTNAEQHSNDQMNQPHEYEEVNQQLTSEYLPMTGTIQPQTNADQLSSHLMNPPYEYEVMDQEGEHIEQMNSKYANIPDTERPYDLPLTGYLSPATTTGEYTQLTGAKHIYDDAQSTLPK